MGSQGRLVLAAIAVALPAGALAGSDCRCRYDGRFFELGEVTCIAVDGRVRRAQCVMALNNTSWSFAEDGSCPVASLAPITAAQRTTEAGSASMADVHRDVK